jgi:hypothetical protein
VDPTREPQHRKGVDADRLRKRWKRILVLGVVLSLGPILGVLGLAYGIGLSFEGEMTPVLTLEVSGVWWSIASAVAGMLAGIVGAGLVLRSFKKLRALESTTDVGA